MQMLRAGGGTTGRDAQNLKTFKIKLDHSLPGPARPVKLEINHMDFSNAKPVDTVIAKPKHRGCATDTAWAKNLGINDGMRIGHWARVRLNLPTKTRPYQRRGPPCNFVRHARDGDKHASQQQPPNGKIPAKPVGT